MSVNRILTDTEFKKEIQTSPALAYLFFGDEDYLKCAYVRMASDLLFGDKSLALFNNIKIDFTDYTPEKLLDAISSYPMMSERKLITLTGFNFNSIKKNELDSFCEILSLLPDYDYNTVIINIASGNIEAGTSKKISATLSRLSEVAVPVRFDSYNGPKLEGWVARHFSSLEVTASPSLIRYFIKYCGNNMFKLSSEIEKLSAYVQFHKRNSVSEEDVRLVCVADTDYDTYALANAILEQRNADALTILGYMKLRRIDPILISGEIFRIFCDLLSIKRLSDEGMNAKEIEAQGYMKSSYKAGIYIKTASKLSYERIYQKILLCEEADKQIKTSLSQGYAPLERLICAE